MTIGFIGLGIMGKPMAKNLLKAGHKLVVYDLVPGPVGELTAAGAETGSSPAEVASKADLVITVLPNSPQVKEAVLGRQGIVEGARQGSLLIDMSSIDPVVSKEVAAALAGRGLGMLDAPVSGGEAKAVEGSLTIMVGGSEADFTRVKPILSAMGSSITRVGEVGIGNTVKLVNQMIVSVTLGVISEAMVFAAKAGVDPNAAYEAIKSGAAGGKTLDAKFPAMLKRNFKPGFKIDLMRKDIRNALGAAEQLGVEVPFSRQTLAVLDALSGDGKGGNDHACMVEYFEQKAGKKLS